MKITVVTPLFPPDIGAPASYVKELATRLGTPDLTVLCFGNFPEHVPNVKITTVKKRRRAISRFYSFSRALFAASRSSDLLYVQNGLSVELPTLLISFITRTPIILAFSDPLATKASEQSWPHRIVTQLLITHVVAIIRDDNKEVYFPGDRPEILPFSPRPNAALEAYETVWEKHLAYLRTIFTYVTE